MILTRHAQERWAERFPGKDIELAFVTARRIGQKTRKQLKAMCPQHAPIMRRTNVSYYYLITRKRIVFVMAPPETVVTVFYLPTPGESKQVDGE
jgi:hypothetical protein